MAKDKEGLQQCRILGSHASVTTACLLMFTFTKGARLYTDTESMDKSIQRVTVKPREEDGEDSLEKFVGTDSPLVMALGSRCLRAGIAATRRGGKAHVTHGYHEQSSRDFEKNLWYPRHYRKFTYPWSTP